MKHVLFVDDEPRLLAGLRRLLHPFRNEWDMTFVGSGPEALAHLEVAPCDVIVSDMQMPGMNGAELLTRVHARNPGIVRMVLSGHPDLELAMRAVPVAHQFLTKPCEPARLRELIERALNLHSLLSDASLRRTIGELRTLPSRPQVFTALTQALADPEVPLRTISAIVGRDIALSTKVLQLINSGFFALPSRVTSIERAVSCVGTSMLKSLLLFVEVFQSHGALDVPGFSLDALHQHAQLTARIAMRLGSDQRADDVFLAAILHDIGKLVLASRMPGHLRAVLDEARQTGEETFAVEQRAGEATHAAVGAYLLGLWGLPYPIVEAVAYHHEPRRVPYERFELLGVVHVADALAHESLSGAPPGADGLPAGIDVAYLEQLGLVQQVSQWRAYAAEETIQCAA
ncbi:MAG TPA: response regulator [Candidatus Binatia bacterium]|jgi:HD-like signal output (HDOD) protein/CheY-like chemotaxis protein